MTEFSKEMLAWIKDGNAVKTGDDSFIEHTTQFSKTFTKQELINFFIREFGSSK